jgi:hypothetical protein
MSDIKGKQVMQEPAVQSNMYNTSFYDQPYQPQMQMPIFNNSMYQQPQMQQPQHQQTFDQSQTDFEAAFAEALKSAEAELAAEQPETSLYNANGVEMEGPIHPPIGSDAINYIEKADRTPDQSGRDADELARTAGQLLDMVKNDSSEKMRNSQFLNLMRQLRDREVEVQGNDLATTTKSTSTLEGQRGYMENETDINPLSLNMQDVDMESGPSQPQSHPQTDTSTDIHSNTNSTFDFPDMNAVYAYHSQTNTQQSLPASGTVTPRNRFPGSWDYPVTTPAPRPSSVPPGMLSSTEMVAEGMLRGDVDTEMYSSHDDEYPRPQSQIQALHPGGKWYPEQKTADVVDAANHNLNGMDDVMSGAVAAYGGTGLMR